MTYRILILLCFSSCIQWESSSRIACAEGFKSRVDGVIEPFLKDKPYLGLVVGIVKQDHTTEALGYGTVKLNGKNCEPNAKTIFEIGSITKVFTATVLANMVNKKLLKLEDPVQKYLPADLIVPRYKQSQITLLHLATHTSELPVQPPLIGFFVLGTKDPSNPYAEYGNKNLAKTLSVLELYRTPGKRFSYSNLGVGILGQALVKQSKAASYEEMIIQQICKPLGMEQTRIKISKEQQLQFPTGFGKNGKPSSQWTFSSLHGCGALRSNVDDMLVFANANLGYKKTKLSSAFQITHQPRLKTSRHRGEIGLCWICNDSDNPKQTIRWHNGGTGGYRSMMILNLEKKTAVVILSNSAHSVDRIAFKIQKLIDIT